MAESVPMPVPGNPASKGAPDGVSATPGSDRGASDRDDGQVHGRSGGGESGGAAYPNPHDKTDDAEGGQTHDISQQGSTTHSGDDPTDSSHGKAPVPTPDRQERAVTTGSGSFTVLETSGVAQAETTGKIGTDAPYEREQEKPGSG